MSRHRPRIVFPGLVPKFTRLRDRVKNPDAFSGSHVEGLNRTGRIAFVLQAIRDAAPDNHQVLVNHRRRALPHLGLVVVVSKSFPQHCVAALPKTGYQLTRSGVDREETVVAVHEDARLTTPRIDSKVAVYAGCRIC